MHYDGEKSRCDCNLSGSRDRSDMHVSPLLHRSILDTGAHFSGFTFPNCGLCISLVDPEKRVVKRRGCFAATGGSRIEETSNWNELVQYHSLTFTSRIFRS